MSGPPKLITEVEHVMHKIKKGKATGLDDISIEMLIAAEKESLKRLTMLLNKIYNTSLVPTDLMRSGVYKNIKESWYYIWTVENIEQSA